MSGKQLVTFHLTGGRSVGIEMDADDLAGAMRMIDNDGHIGTHTSDGKQIWIPARHVTVLDYASDGASAWGNP